MATFIVFSNDGDWDKDMIGCIGFFTQEQLEQRIDQLHQSSDTKEVSEHYLYDTIVDELELNVLIEDDVSVHRVLVTNNERVVYILIAIPS